MEIKLSKKSLVKIRLLFILLGISILFFMFQSSLAPPLDDSTFKTFCWDAKHSLTEHSVLCNITNLATSTQQKSFDMLFSSSIDNFTIRNYKSYNWQNVEHVESCSLHPDSDGNRANDCSWLDTLTDDCSVAWCEWNTIYNNETNTSATTCELNLNLPRRLACPDDNRTKVCNALYKAKGVDYAQCMYSDYVDTVRSYYWHEWIKVPVNYTEYDNRFFKGNKLTYSAGETKTFKIEWTTPLYESSSGWGSYGHWIAEDPTVYWIASGTNGAVHNIDGDVTSTVNTDNGVGSDINAKNGAEWIDFQEWNDTFADPNDVIYGVNFTVDLQVVADCVDIDIQHNRSGSFATECDWNDVDTNHLGGSSGVLTCAFDIEDDWRANDTNNIAIRVWGANDCDGGGPDYFEVDYAYATIHYAPHNSSDWWNSSSYGYRYEIISNATTSMPISVNDTYGVGGTVIWTLNATAGETIYAYCSASGCTGGLVAIANDTDEKAWENDTDGTGNNPASVWSNEGVWHMENKAGVVYDSTGYDNDGTVQSAPAKVTGVFGNALDFDGGDDYINISDSESVDLHRDMTIEFWYYFDSWSSGYYVPVSKVKWADDKKGYAFETAWNPVWAFFVGDGSAGVKALASTTIGTGEWLYLVGEWDGDTAGETRLYNINGTEETTYALQQSGSLDARNTYELMIGRHPDTTNIRWFPGNIDEVRIHNRTLSDKEILEHWYNGVNNLTRLGSEETPEAAGDTCDCPASGDWTIDCSENCEIDADCDMQGNDIYFTGTGIITINADVYNYGSIHGGCLDPTTLSGGVVIASGRTLGADR